MQSMLTTYINDEDQSTACELRSQHDEFTRYLETELQNVKDECDFLETSRESETEFLTLQNANPRAVATDPLSVRDSLYYDYLTSIDMTKEPNLESNFEMLVDPLDSDIEDGGSKFSDTVTSYILDDKIRNSVLEINKLIEDNLARYRRETEKVKAIVAKQHSLKRELYEIELRISNYSVEDAKLRKMQRKKGTACAKTLSNRRTYFCRFGIPYFKTKYRYPADQNEDIKEIVKNDQVMMVRLPKMRRFLPRDAKNLDRSILNQLKLKRIEILNQDMKQLEMSKEKDSDYEQKMQNFRIAIQNAESVTDLEDTLPWRIPIDFMALSKVNPRFSYEDCERIWTLLADPRYSRREFSEDELSRLKTLVDEKGAQNWDCIASALGTNRTGFMCFTKYLSSNRKNKNAPWTKEENELLVKLGERLSYLKKSALHDYWRNIRQRFPNRSYSAIHAHWKYVLQPNLKKGRFTAEEDAILEQLVDEGKTISEIAEILKNRSTVQLRNRYNQMLEQGIIKGAWCADEKKQLIELVQKYGIGNWALISKEMGSRNRVQCRLKYQSMLRNNETTVCQTAIKTKWTHAETILFKQLLRVHGTKFSAVSDAMKTRTPHECRLKYRRLRHRKECDNMHKGKMNQGRWSTFEQRKFADLTRKYGDQFTKISEEMRTRDAAQCELRYNKMLIVMRRKEQKYENRLNELLRVEELKYTETTQKQSDGEERLDDAQQRAKMRSAHQCRLKHRRRIRPREGDDVKKVRMRRGRWSAEEQRKFAELTHKYGDQFTKISEEMRTRDATQCELRYEKILATRRREEQKYEQQLNALLRIEERKYKEMMKQSGQETGCPVEECKTCQTNKGGQKEIRTQQGNGMSDEERQPEKSDDTQPLVKMHSPHECRLKYRHRRHPREGDDAKKVKMKHGRWSADEQRKFAELMQRYGDQFTKISEEMRTRDAAQCELRYEKILATRRREEQKYEQQLNALLRIEERKYKETIEVPIVCTQF